MRGNQTTLFFSLFSLSILPITAIPVGAAPLPGSGLAQPSSLIAQTVTQGLEGEVNVALPVQITFSNQTNAAVAIETPSKGALQCAPTGSTALFN